MAIIFAILLFLISAGGYISEKKNIVNPVTVFSGLWGAVILFSFFGFYTMQVASNRTYILFFIGTVMFVFGYYFNKLFLSKYRYRIATKKISNINVVAIPRYGMMYGLTIVCIIFTLLKWINLIQQAGTLNLGTIQAMLQSGEYESNSSSIINAISNLIISPVAFAIPAVTAADFWFGKRDRKLLALTILLTIINMLSSANRTNFMMLFIYLVLVAYMKIAQKNKNILEKQKKQKKKIRKYIKYLIVFGILAFVIMTMSRGSRLFRNIYLNIAMPPRMFEIWADKIETQHVYGYGIASLLGLFYTIFYIIKNMFGLEKIPNIIQTIYDWTMLTDKQWVWPGDKITANAYVSLFWFFYLDARTIGIIVGSFIFGIVASKSYLEAMSKSSNAKNIAYYCIIFYAILFSFVRLQFTLSKYVLALIFVLNVVYKMHSSREEL